MQKSVLGRVKLIVPSLLLAAGCGHEAPEPPKGVTPVTPSQPSAPPAPEPIALYNGNGLEHWEVPTNPDWELVLAERDGLLVLKGPMHKDLYCKHRYTNHKLLIEWRWPAGEKPGHVGVAMRCLNHKHVTAHIGIGRTGKLSTRVLRLSAPGRWVGRRDMGQWGGTFDSLNCTQYAEKGVDEWNQMEVTLWQETIQVRVNGQLVNEAEGLEVYPGRVALSIGEGTLEIRKIILEPIFKWDLATPESSEE